MTAKMTFFKTKLSPIFFDGSMNLFMSSNMIAIYIYLCFLQLKIYHTKNKVDTGA